MKYILHFVPKALNDLAEIKAYIASDNPERAETYVQELWTEIRTLKSMPLRCSLAPDFVQRDRGIRQHVFGSYRVLFIVIKSHVKILRVVHGARSNISIGSA